MTGTSYAHLTQAAIPFFPDDIESPVATPPRPKYIDIDADGTTDTLVCGQYASRIYDAMRTSEVWIHIDTMHRAQL